MLCLVRQNIMRLSPLTMSRPILTNKLVLNQKRTMMPMPMPIPSGGGENPMLDGWYGNVVMGCMVMGAVYGNCKAYEEVTDPRSDFYSSGPAVKVGLVTFGAIVGFLGGYVVGMSLPITLPVGLFMYVKGKL